MEEWLLQEDNMEHHMWYRSIDSYYYLNKDVRKIVSLEIVVHEFTPKVIIEAVPLEIYL